MNYDDEDVEEVLPLRSDRPRSLEEASAVMGAALEAARALAVEHRDKLLGQGFDTDSANNVAATTLYDIQSAMLSALWP